MRELEPSFKELEKLTPDKRNKRVEKILDTAFANTERYQQYYGIIDVDTLTVNQAFALINTDFGMFGFLDLWFGLMLFLLDCNKKMFFFRLRK